MNNPTILPTLNAMSNPTILPTLRIGVGAAVHRLEALARCSALDYHAQRACESAAQILNELALRAKHDDRIDPAYCHRHVAESLLLTHGIDPNKLG